VNREPDEERPDNGGVRPRRLVWRTFEQQKR
jgi:hypothetical protein